MGYPFDRRIEQREFLLINFFFFDFIFNFFFFSAKASLDAFANAYGNMAMQQVTVRFSNRYVNRT